MAYGTVRLVEHGRWFLPDKGSLHYTDAGYRLALFS